MKRVLTLVIIIALIIISGCSSNQITGTSFGIYSAKSSLKTGEPKSADLSVANLISEAKDIKNITIDGGVVFFNLNKPLSDTSIFGSKDKKSYFLIKGNQSVLCFGTLFNILTITDEPENEIFLVNSDSTLLLYAYNKKISQTIRLSDTVMQKINEYAGKAGIEVNDIAESEEVFALHPISSEDMKKSKLNEIAISGPSLYNASDVKSVKLDTAKKELLISLNNNAGKQDWQQYVESNQFILICTGNRLFTGNFGNNGLVTDPTGYIATNDNEGTLSIKYVPMNNNDKTDPVPVLKQIESALKAK